MKSHTALFLWILYFTECGVIYALDPIGLKVSASLRGLRLGAAITVNNLRNNVDQGQYNYNLVKNYQLIVPGLELKPQHMARRESIQFSRF